MAKKKPAAESADEEHVTTTFRVTREQWAALRREALALNQDAMFSTRLLADATTGSLFKCRFRSATSPLAVSYRRVRSFSRHFITIQSRSVARGEGRGVEREGSLAPDF